MLRRLLSAALLVSIIAGPFVPADMPAAALAARHNAVLKKGAYSSRFMLKKNGIISVFGPGINQVVIRGKRHLLSEAPYFRQGKLYVSSEFVRIFTERVLNAEGALWQTVTIDAGHGGKDPGAVSPCNGLYEKNVVLDIARRLKKELRKKGVRVIMTRDRDEFVSLEERPACANKSKSHVFVSIHADACTGTPDAEGVTVFYGDDWPDSNITVRTRANFLAGQMDLSHFSFGNYRRAYSREEEAFIFGLMVRESNRQGRILAEMIADGLSEDTGSFNRGVKTKNLRVIRRCACPAVLVEVGFLTNRREARRLAGKSERRKIAKSLSDTICRYLRKYVKKQ